jgi:hypothetical protein
MMDNCNSNNINVTNIIINKFKSYINILQDLKY